VTTVTGQLDAALHAEHVGHAMHVGLVHCHGSLPLRAVARIMAAHRIHAVVVDAEAGEDRPAVVSDLDLVGALAGGVADELTAADIAATHLVTVAAADSLATAAQAMARSRTGHALVLRSTGEPVGILSALDIANALAAD
jgi:CBS domain-containing protein